MGVTIGRRVVAPVLCLLLSVGCATATPPAEPIGIGPPTLAAPTGWPDGPAIWKESPGLAAAPELHRFNELLSELAERMKPALVHIRVRRAADPKPATEEIKPPGEPRRASGSGFFISPTGLLVTNAHVVEGAEHIQVRLADGRRLTGELVGTDSRIDLALVRVEASADLPVLPLGDSNRLKVGEFVLALGHPFGLEHTVSFGIVSRKGSALTIAAPGFDFIQTDAAINPGNSGGPLINMAGEVVGVNSMAARNGSIGFAIPSNLVKMLAPQLATKGRIDWGWLGVSIAEIGDDDLEKFKLKEARGVLIREVMAGEPAEKGGLRPNDIVVSIDGTAVEGPRDLQRIVSSTPVGTRIRMGVLRDGKLEDLEITVGLYKPRPSPR
jgi:serine protease Do